MRTLAWTTATLLLLLPACASNADQAAEPSEVAAAPTQAPSSGPSPTDPATAAASPTPAATEPTEAETTHAPPTPRTGQAKSAPREVELWFIRDTGTRAYIEPELHPLPGSTPAIARATIELLIATEPRDPKLFNGLPDGTRLLDVALKDGILTVDLDFPNDTATLGSLYEGYVYQQLAFTGAQFSTVDRVRVLEEGGTPSSGHLGGLDKPQRPRERGVSPVVITAPRHRQAVAPGSVTVSGTANVYEATVLLRLVNPEGRAVKRTFTTATCGTGCRGDWEHTFANVTTPGTWKVIAGASDASDGEGPPPYTVRRTFVVR